MFIDLTQIQKSWDMLWGILHNVNEQNCIIIKTKTTYRIFFSVLPLEFFSKGKIFHSLTHKKWPYLHNTFSSMVPGLRNVRCWEKEKWQVYLVYHKNPFYQEILMLVKLSKQDSLSGYTSLNV